MRRPVARSAESDARRGPQSWPRPIRRRDAEVVYRALTAIPSTSDGKPRRSKLSESVKVDDKVLFTIALKGGRFTLNPKQIKEDELPDLYEDLKAYAHRWLKDRGRAAK